MTGAKSAGQKIVDAHATDYYHARCKIGDRSTRNKFTRVGTSWVV